MIHDEKARTVAEKAERCLDLIERTLDDLEDEPSLALWKAVGRVSAASNALWHRIGAMRADAVTRKEDA